MNIIDSLEEQELIKSRVKVRLAELELQQTDLAKEFEVTTQTFNAWVTGRITPTLKTALKLSYRLGVTVNELYELKEE